MLSASANSITGTDAQASYGTDSGPSARFPSGVIPLLGPLEHRALRTRNHDDAGPNPAATEASISRFAELVARAVVAGYRNPLNEQSLADVSRRPFSIESLLDGRELDEWTLWEVANQLQLPTSGQFVVVAAEVSSAGSEALPGIESKLRGLDVYSAWLLLPDLRVGILHIHSQPTKSWRWCLG